MISSNYYITTIPSQRWFGSSRTQSPVTLLCDRALSWRFVARPRTRRSLFAYVRASRTIWFRKIASPFATIAFHCVFSDISTVFRLRFSLQYSEPVPHNFSATLHRQLINRRLSRNVWSVNCSRLVDHQSLSALILIDFDQKVRRISV